MNPDDGNRIAKEMSEHLRESGASKATFQYVDEEGDVFCVSIERNRDDNYIPALNAALNERNKEWALACKERDSLHIKRDQFRSEAEAAKERYADLLERCEGAFARIRELCGATPNDPMPAEHYVEVALTAARAQLAQVTSERDALDDAESLRAILAENAELKAKLEVVATLIENADGCIADADETLMEREEISVSGYQHAREQLSSALAALQQQP